MCLGETYESCLELSINKKQFLDNELTTLKLSSEFMDECLTKVKFRKNMSIHVKTFTESLFL